MLGSPSLQNYHWTHLHANGLFGKHVRKNPFLSTNVSTWSLLNVTGTLTGTVLWLNENWPFGNKHSGWVWCKKKDDYTENNLIPTVQYGKVWRVCDVVGLFFLQRPWEPR